MAQTTTPTKFAIGRDDGGNIIFSNLIDSGLTDNQGNHLVYQLRGGIARPTEVGPLGAYMVSAESGVIAAGITGGSTVFSFRWSPSTAGALALIKRIQATVVSGGTAFTAGLGVLTAIWARAFSASDSGGTTLTPTGNTAKLRTSFGTSQVADLRISSTAALTPGTRTPDGDNFGLAVFAVPATTNTVLLPQTDLLNRDSGDGDWPGVLANNEGFIITTSMPATGTWQFQVIVDWLEVPTY